MGTGAGVGKYRVVHTEYALRLVVASAEKQKQTQMKNKNKKRYHHNTE